MKNLAILLLLLATGCTKIATKSTIGELVPDEDASPLVGSWFGFSDSEHRVSYDSGGKMFTVVYREDDGEEKTGIFQATRFNDDILILWFYDSEESIYLPLRILHSFDESGEGFVSILLPDQNEVERLIGKGLIVRSFQTKDTWILESEGLENHIRSKDFWDLKNVIHLHKRIAHATVGVD